MNVGEVLRDVDPVRHEGVPSDGRDAMRRKVLDAAARAVLVGSVGHVFSRRRLLIGASAVVLVAVGIWSRAGVSAAVQFEIRVAGDDASSGFVEMTLPSGKRVYVANDAVVTNDDVQSAAVVHLDADGFGVRVEFTPEGAQKMFAATSGNIGGRLAVLINDEIVMAPTIRAAVSNIALITGHYSEEAAERIAKGIQVR